MNDICWKVSHFIGKMRSAHKMSINNLIFHIILWSLLIILHIIEDNLPLIAIPYEHTQKTIPSWLCVCNSVIRLFPETNHVGDKIFRSKHEIILEKSNTLWKYLNTNTFLYGKLKYLEKVFKYFQIQMYLTSYLLCTMYFNG